MPMVPCNDMSCEVLSILNCINVLLLQGTDPALIKGRRSLPLALLEDGSSYKGKRAIKWWIRMLNYLPSVPQLMLVPSSVCTSSVFGFLLAFFFVVVIVSFHFHVVIFVGFPSSQTKVSEKKTM